MQWWMSRAVPGDVDPALPAPQSRTPVALPTGIWHTPEYKLAAPGCELPFLLLFSLALDRQHEGTCLLNKLQTSLLHI